MSTEAVKEHDPDQAVNLEETVRFCLQEDLAHDDSNIAAIRDISSDPVDNRPQVLLDGWTIEDVRTSQLQDCEISILLTALENSSGRPNWDQVSSGKASLKTLWSQWDRLSVKDGLLFCIYYDTDLDEDYNLLVVPASKRSTLLYHFHDIPTSGHLGSDKMLYKLKHTYYWPGMKEDVVDYCSSCDVCVARKTPSIPKGHH